MLYDWFLVNSNLLNPNLALKHRVDNFKSVKMNKRQTKGQILHFRGFLNVDSH